MSAAENPYPTYEALRAARATVAGAPNSAKLLFMPVQGTVQSAIAVLSDQGDPDTRTPYYD
jgi:poly(3-hydroxybutyrate) depolymerase